MGYLGWVGVGVALFWVRGGEWGCMGHYFGSVGHYFRGLGIGAKIFWAEVAGWG